MTIAGKILTITQSGQQPFDLGYVNKGDSSCGGNSPCYTTIQGAANAAGTGAVIKVAAGTYAEGLSLGTKNLTISGGWDSSFTTRLARATSSNTIITGTMAITGSTGGAVTIDDLVLEGSSGNTYINSLGQTFKLIPTGTFTMGFPVGEGNGWEMPQHTVTLTQPFYMQTTEVTQAQWEAVMGINPSWFSGCPTCPVERVSWNDVQNFIALMNARGEGTYSLPTEAQWEYAARAGSTTAFYNGGITEIGCEYDPNLDAIGWYCYNSDDKTHPVAGKTPNTWGLYDMSGNVSEWVQDWFANYPSSAVTDPTGPSSGSYRVFRGGAWMHWAVGCRSASRNYDYPDYDRDYLGFRLLRQP